MKSETNNGGPAFPLPEGSETPAGSEGMTLRDYFAAHATEEDIHALRHRIPDVRVARPDGSGRMKLVFQPPENWRQIARYMHADQMLAARKQET